MSARALLSALRTFVEDLDRRRRHRGAARALLKVDPEPESWLDVGTGEGAFPQRAKRLFPYTSFDGIDPTTRVTQARHTERVEEAYVGRLTDPRITTALRARYDVVTLLRPPESTEELHAALSVLRPTGLLLVETPQARRDDVRTELEARSCTIVTAPRPVLDRLSRTSRIIARPAPSAP